MRHALKWSEFDGNNLMLMAQNGRNNFSYNHVTIERFFIFNFFENLIKNEFKLKNKRFQ